MGYGHQEKLQLHESQTGSKIHMYMLYNILEWTLTISNSGKSK